MWPVCKAVQSRHLENSLGTLNKSESIMLSGDGYLENYAMLASLMSSRRDIELIVSSNKLKSSTSSYSKEAKRLKVIENSMIGTELIVYVFRSNIDGGEGIYFSFKSGSRLSRRISLFFFVVQFEF